MKMMPNRRDFLKISAAGTLGIMALNPLACSNLKNFSVGLQLYSIRDAMAVDAIDSLQKISDLGYQYIELADYANGKFYGFAPKELKKIVNDLGMEILSSHTQVEAAGITIENAAKMVDDHAEIGVKYCIQPWINEVDRNIESYKRMIEDWNKIGQKMKDADIQFGYHNHNFEFANIDGIVPYYDLFMPEMDADLITMEIDLFWVNKAGQDPIEMFEKYPGRFQLLHYKDMLTNEAPYYDVIKDDICSVGAGVIDFKRILAFKDLAGMKYGFVEDDNQGNGKPFEALEISINNLTTDIL